MHVLLGYGLCSLVSAVALAAEVDPEELKAFEEARPTPKARSRAVPSAARATEAVKQTKTTRNYRGKIVGSVEWV